MKTLDQAIGCWTTDPTALRARSKIVSYSIRRCRELTLHNEAPEELLRELQLLNTRIGSLADVASSALKRCEEIIKHGETK